MIVAVAIALLICWVAALSLAITILFSEVDDIDRELWGLGLRRHRNGPPPKPDTEGKK